MGLKIAGGGLNKEDAGKTITEDIQYLESKIEEETVSSEKDWKTCLSNSENDEAKEMKSANGAYSDAEKKLVATNVKEEAKYGRTLKSKTKQSKQRLAASQGTLNEAVSRHNDASNKNKKAQQKLKIAQEFQFDEVATSKTIRITELKRAADKKARYIADKNEEAKETRDDAQETFDAHTTSKNEECSTERGILKEEKDTLKLTSMKIGKLQVVDNTAADNKAAAEKAAADKAAAEKAAAKKAAADKAAAKKAAADKAAAEKAAAEKTFFHHPAEMACKRGGSWKRPYGNVKSTKAGFESCGSKCKAGGFKYFGLECPSHQKSSWHKAGEVHCQCASELSSSKKQDPKQCSGGGNKGHCNGPFVTEGGYSLGGHGLGSVYSVSSYYITEKNENCQVTSNVITSKEECAFALKKVGKSDRFVWNSVHQGIPGGCSVRGSADGHYDNRGLQGTVGEKRGDLRAVCKGTKPLPTFFEHPAEMACKSGGSWTRPYGNVKSTKAGFESCGSQCKAGGFKYFGLECPMRGPRGDKGKVHCQCTSDLSSSNKIDPKQCSGARNLGHCNGPFVTEGGYSLGAHSYGSVYSVASYYITEVNQNCGVTGNVITSKEECAFALKKVGKSDRFVWNGIYKSIPGGCSVRGSADGHYDNRGLQGTVGEQRGDLRAVCKRFGESKSFGAPYSVWP